MKKHYEREQKFLVDHPIFWRVNVKESVRIKQFFLTPPDSESVVRLRLEYHPDGKSEAFWISKEYEGRGQGTAKVTMYPLPIKEAEEMLENYRANDADKAGFIEKTRHFLHIPGKGEWCVDEFHGALEGFVLAEHEFKNEAYGPFIKPAWLGPEVTKDWQYKNQALAKFGIPELPAKGIAR